MQAFINEYGGQMLTKSAEHLYISAIALGLGILVAVPLGIVLTRLPKISNLVIGIASVLQTIPSLALLALMIPFFRCREISGDYRTVYLFAFADFAKHLYRDEKC